jgi:uncharacterized membrane protein YkvI
MAYPNNKQTYQFFGKSRRVLTYAGAIVAFLIGSGFATGQEILQCGDGRRCRRRLRGALRHVEVHRRGRLAVAVGISVWFGLKSLVDVIGKIGPLIVVIAIALGVLGIVGSPGWIAEGNALLPELALTQASTNWFMAGLSYVGFCMLWLAAFLTALGKTARSRKEAASGALVGAIAFSVACVLVGLGLLANITRVGNTEIPMLVLASDVNVLLASGISVMILAGIYTTAVPLLWTVSSRFFADKTPRFKYLTITLAAVGTVIGLVLPFSQMVNIVYVVNGYVGILLLVLMLAKTGTRLVRRQAL